MSWYLLHKSLIIQNLNTINCLLISLKNISYLCRAHHEEDHPPTLGINTESNIDKEADREATPLKILTEDDPKTPREKEVKTEENNQAEAKTDTRRKVISRSNQRPLYKLTIDHKHRR